MKNAHHSKTTYKALVSLVFMMQFGVSALNFTTKIKLVRKFWVVASVAALTVSGLTSCSDDDDPAPDPGTDPSVKEDMFPYGLYQTDEVENIVCNSDGDVTKIELDGANVYFNYLEPSSDADVRVIMDAGGMERGRIEAKLNNAGFIAEMKGKLAETDTTFVDIKYELKYNDDYQLNYVKMSDDYGHTATYNISYIDGDIVKVEFNYEDDQESLIFGYTDSEHPTPILNKGGLMLFGWECYDVDDFGFFDYLYLAKLLGKPTKHLPLSYEDNYDDYSIEWTFDVDDLPTSFYSWTGFDFTWPAK